MRSNALYFPFIDIPNSSWMIHTLLYWDKVSSIVPLEYVLRPSAHTKFMRDMVEAELVEQVFPSHHIWKIDGFEETFIRYIKSKLPMLQKERPQKCGVRSCNHAPPRAPRRGAVALNPERDGQGAACSRSMEKGETTLTNTGEIVGMDSGRSSLSFPSQD